MAELKTLFGAMLRKARTARGLSQVALADKAGVALETVAKLERGVSGATFEMVEKLARALEIGPSSLFGVDVSNDPEGRLQALLVMLSRLDDDKLEWVTELVTAALSAPKKTR